MSSHFLSPWSDDRENSRNLSRLQREIDQIFSDFVGTSFSSRRQGQMGNFTPAVDVEETNSEYLITFDVPGISKDNVNIEVRDNQLIVSGTREDERTEEDKDRRHLFRERSYGEFQRIFSLPSIVNTDQIEANFEDGVLRIMLPKSEAAKPKQIKVQSGKGGGILRKISGGLFGGSEQQQESSEESSQRSSASTSENENWSPSSTATEGSSKQVEVQNQMGATETSGTTRGGSSRSTSRSTKTNR